MLRRALLALVLALVAGAPLAVSASPALAVNSCVLSSPHSSDVYLNTVTVSWTCTAAPSEAQLVWTYVSGPNSGTVTSPVTMTLALTTGQSTGSFTFAPPTASTNAAFTSVSSALLDGTWTVRLIGTIGGVDSSSAIVSNVTTSTETAPPILTSPAASTTQNALQIGYSLPDTPAIAADGVSLALTDVNTSAVTTLYLSDLHQSASFSENPADLTTNADVTSIAGSTSLPAGTYDVALTYSDSDGHPPATTTADGWTLETATAPPTLSPPTGGTDGAPLGIDFTLPDVPLASSATLTFSGPTNVVLTLDAMLSGSSSLTIDPGDLAASAGVSAVSPAGAALAAGTYTVTLAYQDFLGNVASDDVQQNVVISAAQPAPSAPVGSAPVTSTPVATTPVVVGGPAGGPAAPSNHFDLALAPRRAGGGAVTVAVRVPGAGALDLLGTHSRPASGALSHGLLLRPGWDRLAYGRAGAVATSAGEIRLTLHPSAAGARLLARERRLGNALRIRVWITFTPAGGSPSSRAVTVRVLARRNRAPRAAGG